jgi:hypothetical protein
MDYEAQVSALLQPSVDAMDIHQPTAMARSAADPLWMVAEPLSSFRENILEGNFDTAAAYLLLMLHSKPEAVCPFSINDPHIPRMCHWMFWRNVFTQTYFSPFRNKMRLERWRYRSNTIANRSRRRPATATSNFYGPRPKSTDKMKSAGASCFSAYGLYSRLISR